MKLALLNQSTVSADLTAPVLGQIADAVQRQLVEHAGPMWQAIGPSLRPVTSLADVASDESPLVLLDNADQAGALGYHDVGPDGRPYARVFVGTILGNGGSLLLGGNSVSACVSHEALEAMMDPYCVWWSDSPDGSEYALEVGDPVEADSYDIDGVGVSNFVGPRWFSQGAGPYDYMVKLSAPFTMSPGGYLIKRNAGVVSQVFGESYPEWKKPGKVHQAARTRKRGAK